jgi:5'-methylthioadenosine phosphorylase
VGRLAVIGKEGTLGSPVASARVATPQPIRVLDHGTHVTLYRHGLDTYVPPHRIDHAAHLRTLLQLGCDRVLALSSVGSLRVDLPVGSFVAPDDFIALDQTPADVDDADARHVVPGFTDAWRHQIVTVWRRVAGEPIVDRGVYWQANGPRFETPAEIRLIGGFADLVGMTVASECVAANQLGIAYAAVCIVDNLANGVGDTPLTTDEFERGAAANATSLTAALGRVIPELAA